MWEGNRSRIAKTVLKKENHFVQFQDLLNSYNK